MGYLTSKYIKNKTKLELVNLAVNIGFYVLIIGMFVYVGGLDYQCRVLLPSGEIYTIPLTHIRNQTYEVPKLLDWAVKVNITWGNCTEEVIAVKRVECNYSEWEEDVQSIFI